MEAILSDDFLIIGLRRLLKSISHSCVTCRRAYQRTQHQMMDHLPTDRTRPEPPYTIVGVDFAGPLTTTEATCVIQHWSKHTFVSLCGLAPEQCTRSSA